ncbi:gastrula zinc finger protein XlCGF57.1-like isoform X6 [Trichoplusia ni]|uniref:Gastrula zinc finger protein XlCGF57.1-like isoform X6 n=1 Tax=Trichoplusia ni TaxID=7111 RepID=A0A7E5WTT6_TRINI|nr:gastrula zinc finger protein XlCGF57.1-like isoform X6 [Trichoplusia ni]
MMEFDEIVVKETPGLCRCCLSEGCYKDLGSEYSWMNETEVYADMLLECFDISITQHNEGPNGPNRLICEVCITRLRDACNFKKQVLDSEKKFIDMMGRGEFRPKMLIYQTQMKAEDAVEAVADDAEVEYLEDDIDFGEEDLIKDETEPSVSDITVSTLPVKGKRGRPRKNALVKPEKRLKTKVDDKKKVVAKDESEGTDDKRLEKKRKDDLTRLVTVVLENSTIMPFRWAANKYMCFFCCCTFVDSVKLKEHTAEEHKGAKLKNVLRSLIGSSRIKLDISNIICRKCSKSFNNFELFLSHVATVHDMKFNKDMSQSLFTFSLSDEGMSCLDCGQEFRFFGPLLKHSHKFHNKYKTYLCEICGQGFIAKANVDSHIKNVHSFKNRQCQKCDKVFRSPYALEIHRERTHKTEMLKCPKCPEILASKYLKKRHLALVHDVKKLQFHCDECDKVYTMKSKLVEHKLRTHLKQKTVECEICGFKVFNNELLKRHMVRHDDSRPYSCEFCKKSFQRKKTLEVHTRIHTNDRRYACKECGRAFVQVTSWKLHMRVHHGGNEGTSWH